MFHIAYAPQAISVETPLQRYIHAGSSNLPILLLIQFAHDLDYKVRRRVAENVSTPGTLLECLAEDSSEEVRIAVSENPTTPFHVLASLTQDQAVSVRYDMADNPRLSHAIHLILTQDENPYVAARAQSMVMTVGAYDEPLAA
jgi:hypothetical protein